MNPTHQLAITSARAVRNPLVDSRLLRENLLVVTVRYSTAPVYHRTTCWAYLFSSSMTHDIRFQAQRTLKSCIGMAHLRIFDTANLSPTKRCTQFRTLVVSVKSGSFQMFGVCFLSSKKRQPVSLSIAFHELSSSWNDHNGAPRLTLASWRRRVDRPELGPQTCHVGSSVCVGLPGFRINID